jgi:hypothetical protein
VRRADHGAILHRGVVADHALHLGRVDVEAAADDHVLLAVDDVQIPVGVLDADVARVMPAPGPRCDRFRLVAVVTGEQR